jgi:predicted cobalt transporter CbtA
MGVTYSASPATDEISAVVRTLLVRGMLVGILAGLISFAFLKVYGEPQVDIAIAFETQQDIAKEAAAQAKGVTMDEQPDLFSRQVQAGIGLFVAVMVYATAFGGLFALAFAFAYGRLPGVLTPQGTALTLAVMGFVAVYLVPSLKYPANPPSVGEAHTIGMRTALYFLMIAVSIVAMIGAVALKRLLVGRFGDWNATVVVAVYYIVVVMIAGFLLPAVNEVPVEFPAVVLWKFRVASIGAQFILWATLGLVFGALTERAAAASATLRT